jgi:glucose-1-phosphate adenylyltransferase
VASQGKLNIAVVLIVAGLGAEASSLAGYSMVYDEQPDLVAVFGADHVFRMDPMQMIAQHAAAGADVTVAAIPVLRLQAMAFRVIQTSPNGRTVEAFAEKPADPPPHPGTPRCGLRVDGHLRLHQ